MHRAVPWIALAALVLLGVAATVCQLTRPSPDGPGRGPRGGARAVPSEPGGRVDTPRAESPTTPSDAPSEAQKPTSPAAAKARVDGVVRSKDGHPAASVVTADGEAQAPVSVRSDDDGRFVMNLPAGCWSVRAEAPGRISATEILTLKEGDAAHLELTLLTAATISGAVTDPDGQPLPGAVIATRLVSHEGESAGIDFTGSAGAGAGAVTDERGRYRVTALPGTQTLQAEKAGFGPAFAQVLARAGEETTCDLRLAKPLRISGRVCDKNGRPIEGASVTSAWYGLTEGMYGAWYSRFATSGPDGSYALEDLREGLHNVTAMAQGYVTDARYQVAAGTGNVDFALARGARIEGRVVRKSDGSPVDMPSVSCRPVSRQTFEQNQITIGKEGTFSVQGVGPGKHYIEAHAKGFAPGRSEEFDVAPEQTITGVVVALTPGGGLHGVVLSQRTRQPVEGATITCLQKTNPAAPSKTGKDGRFTLENLPPGKVRLRVEHDEFANLVRTVEISEGKVAEEEFLLGDGSRIYGRVLDYGDRPKAGVMLFAMSPTFTGEKFAQTDKDGKYELKGLAPGTYMVFLPEFGAWNTRTVKVKEGESVRVDFTPSDGVRLHGSVRQGGRVLPNVEMQFIATSGGGAMMMAQTDAAGNYELTGVRPGEYSVVVNKTMTKCTIPSGQREARKDFELPTGTVSGRVYDVATREKVAGAEVQAYRTVGATGGMAEFLDWFAGSATTDAEGAYELSGLSAGEYVLQVTKEGYAAELGAPFQMPADGNVSGVDFFLSRGARIEGVARDGRGHPVAGATFSLRDRKTGILVVQTELWMTQSDEDGRFTLPWVRAGEYVLGVHAQGHASAQRVVRVTPGRDTVMDVVLPDAGTIRVVVRDAAGAPVEGATLMLIDAEGNAVEASMGPKDLFDPSRWRTGADGRIERGGIAPGHYWGEVTDGARKASFEVDIVAGQVAEVGVVTR